MKEQEGDGGRGGTDGGRAAVHVTLGGKAKQSWRSGWTGTMVHLGNRSSSLGLSRIDPRRVIPRGCEGTVLACPLAMLFRVLCMLWGAARCPC